MSSNLLIADNGVISGVSGVNYKGGSDGTLQIQTTTSAGTATTAMTIDNNQRVTFASAVNYPTWTTAGRPSSPVAGTTGYNTTYGGLEIYNGTAWDTITGGPAFSAYASVGTSMTNNTWTKILFQTKDFDTNNNYDTSASRFTPTVAGYYSISAAIQAPASGAAYYSGVIYKNGAAYIYGTASASVGIYIQNMNTLVYLNGSTDYVEIYANQSTGGTITSTAASTVKFQACLVRGA